MKPSSILSTLFVARQISFAAGDTVEEPAQSPLLGSEEVQGCFSSAGSLQLVGTIQFNSKGACAKDKCGAEGKPVAATSAGNLCYCGDTYPPESTLVDDSKCNVGCTGYGTDACGGVGFWTVYNTGLLLGIEHDPDPSSSTSEPSGTSTTSSATGETIVVTATASTDEGSSGRGSNTVGIAVGAVVGALAAAALLAAIFFYVRRRRNSEIEQEHRRNAANSIIGISKPGSSGGLSATDSRMDPVMAQRRISNGSIADEQDYSRRILRVTNA